MNIVDTSAWIEYFYGEPNAEGFSKPIRAVHELLVPAICLYEVFKKVLSDAGEDAALKAVAHMKQGKVVPLSEEIALKAALVSIRHKLPMADSIIYATALLHGASVWTQDEHFQALPHVHYMKKARTKRGRACARAKMR